MKHLMRLLPAAFIAFFAICPAHADEVDAAIVFCIDVSSSMQEPEQKAVRQAHAYALTSPDVVGAIRESPHQRMAVAVVEYGADAVVTVPWSIVTDEASAVAVANALMSPRATPNNGSTRPAACLQLAGILHAGSPFISAKRVVDVVGDGKGTIQSARMRDALVGDGITINAMILDSLSTSENRGVVFNWYRDNLVGGQESFVMEAVDVGGFPAAMRRKLMQELF